MTTAGEAFFRVEHGGEFVVDTPSGSVAVLGTCFTVTVGAGVTTVDVHEGTVELHDRTSGLRLHPGQRGHLGGGGPARLRPPAASSSGPPRTVAARPLTPDPSARGDQCFCMSDPRHLEAKQAMLDRWAAQCRIRADLPPLSDGPDDLAAIDEAMDQLGLTAGERDAFRDAAQETSRVGLARIHDIYTVATGESAAGLDLADLLEQIENSRALGEDARLRARLAQERAGHVPPRSDPAQMTPYEELYRLIIEAGDDLERRLAERLGTTRARALRLRYGGWPGPDFDWIGCPPS